MTFRAIEALNGMIIGRICAHAHMTIKPVLAGSDFRNPHIPLNMRTIIAEAEKSDVNQDMRNSTTSTVAKLISSDWSRFPHGSDIWVLYESMLSKDGLRPLNSYVSRSNINEETIMLLAPLLIHCVSRGLSIEYVTGFVGSEQIKRLESCMDREDGSFTEKILTLAGYSERRAREMNQANYDEFMRDILIYGGNGALAGFIKGWFLGNIWNNTYEPQQIPGEWLCSVRKSKFHIPGIVDFAEANFKNSRWR